jgi:hypothetical protein
MKKELKSFEELESLLKKHNVTYPKHWESKFKKIKRKERNTSTWKDCRMVLYASARVIACLETIINQVFPEQFNYFDRLAKFIKENSGEDLSKFSLSKETINKATEDFAKDVKKSIGDRFYRNIIKKGGKSYYKANLRPETLKLLKLLRIEIKRFVKLPNKKVSIVNVMKQDFYWDYRYEILNKPKEDKNNQRLVRKEEQEYYKSVCHYIDQPKYNKNLFFKLHGAEFWEKNWNFHLKVR